MTNAEIGSAGWADLPSTAVAGMRDTPVKSVKPGAPTLARLLFALHFVAGLVFAVVDTDQFLSELNPFTLDWLFGEDPVCRAYNWGFTFYFGYLATRYVRAAHLRWWKPAAVGLAAIYWLVPIAIVVG